jgi:hypothetical protein
MVPTWKVGHPTFSKPDAHKMLLAGKGQRNSTETVALFRLAPFYMATDAAKSASQ